MASPPSEADRLVGSDELLDLGLALMKQAETSPASGPLPRWALARAEAMDLIRSMIERVELVPAAESKGLDARLYGDLAAILAACEGAQTRKLPGSVGSPGSQLSVVAGTRNQRCLHPIRCRVPRVVIADR
jgi:hypothetical protein